MRHAPPILIAATLLASCGHSPRPQTLSRPKANPPALHFGSQPVAPINRDLSAAESLWHVRAGLNVAALSCRDTKAIAPAYNQMLSVHHAALAAAAKADQARFGTGTDAAKHFDRHQTQLYNYFANPVAQRQFCASATSLLSRINAMPSTQLAAAAPRSLAELEAPFRRG